MNLLSANLARVQKTLRYAGWRARAAVGPPASVDVEERSDDGWVAVCNEPAFIDPLHGFIVTDRGHLLENSLEPNFDHLKASWRSGVPSPVRFGGAKLQFESTVVELPCVVSLRHRWEWNYYHFFLDVLGKLDLIDSVGVDRRTPIVLGRYARQFRFAREVLATGALAHRRWVVPDVDNRLVVRAERVIYCRTFRPFKARVTHLLDEMELPVPDPESDGRIFLTRRPPATRCLGNEEQLLPVLQRFGFRVIDTASMSMADQIDAFATARYVIALHGAGITNIIFRRGAPLDLLELHASTFAGPGDMLRLCHELGYRHHDLAGEQDRGKPIHADFRIDPAQLQHAIETILACD